MARRITWTALAGLTLTTAVAAAGTTEPAADGGQRNALLADLGSALKSRAVGGELAGQLSDSRFGLIHDPALDGEEVEAEILGLAKTVSESPESVSLGRKTVDLESGALSQEEAGQALVYTINQFATANEASLTIESLQAGYERMVKQTTARIARLKSFVEGRRFELYAQPVVDLESRKLRHCELLLRFEDGRSPYPWITFAEGVGMIQDLDMAVLMRAVELLRHPAADRRAAVAVNVSGCSISNAQFVDDLIQLLLTHQSLSERLSIEVTESSQIEDLEQVNKILLSLRGIGFKIGLDDFGAGAASFQYLRALDVEFVKFDGAYVRSILESERDLLMLKAMAGLCRDLDIRTVAEMIEQEEQARQLYALGIERGQGYLFGKPVPAGDYGIGPASGPKATAGKTLKARYNPYTQAEISLWTG